METYSYFDSNKYNKSPEINSFNLPLNKINKKINIKLSNKNKFY